MGIFDIFKVKNNLDGILDLGVSKLLLV